MSGKRFGRRYQTSINSSGGGRGASSTFRTCSGTSPSASGDVRLTSSAADLYTILLKGKDADGSVGLGANLPDGRYVSGENNPGPIKLIVKGRNTSSPSGLDDPFDEVMSVAWKSWYAGAVLNANWMRGIRVAATNLSN